MTELTTLLFPTATAASSLVPTAPASVTGVPVVAGQFAQTLGDLLAGTPAVAAPAPAPAAVIPANTATDIVAAPSDVARSLPILGLVGPLPNGKLLAAGLPDRQPLADDGNAVPAEPAFQLLANPTWRATVGVTAAPPRTPVSLRNALERAAAQLATPVVAKAARGSVAMAGPESVPEDADATSVASDAATADPITPPSPPVLPAIPPATLVAAPIATPQPDPATAARPQPDSAPPVVAASIERGRGTPAPVATPIAVPAATASASEAAMPVAEPVAVLIPTPTIPTRPSPQTTAPQEAILAAAPGLGQAPARSINPAATALQDGDAPPVGRAAPRATLAPSPAGTAAALPIPTPVAPVTLDSTPPTSAVAARASRLVPTDSAILAALGAVPGRTRDIGTTPAGSAPVVAPLPLAAPTPASPIPTNTAPVLDSVLPTPPSPTLLAPGTVPVAQTITAPGSTTTTATTPPPADTPDAPTFGDPAPVHLAPSSISTIAVSTTPQPAGQVFAAAFATAASWRERAPLERPVSVDSDPAAPTPPLGFTTAVDLGSTTPVQPTGDAQRAPLDLTQDTGVQRMIDHIEVLRDHADSRDTRIRLVPDALGSVDVAVRQVGERIHVSFTAEHEATRALIADAQPRLTELAAERGVRIVGSSVATDANSGASSSPQQGQAQAQAQSQSQPQSQNPSQSRSNAPQQPPRASARAQRDAETPEDQRLA